MYYILLLKMKYTLMNIVFFFFRKLDSSARKSEKGDTVVCRARNKTARKERVFTSLLLVLRLAVDCYSFFQWKTSSAQG